MAERKKSVISQLTLRASKKLIELLKNRAGRKKISVNALTERSLLQDEFLQLSTDPYQSLRQVYRKITTWGHSARRGSKPPCISAVSWLQRPSKTN
ncbi:hypothetical protein [Klebsiella aerogenes]|uniref:hypothetical protein n=1 Tax=Klebsiella aerogenes TaxID=548 RepID=UPI00178C3F21|nr:hypothetical protein [Klebsiella aerogenes]